MPDVTFVADVECVGPTCAVARTREFSFKVDEPEELGGTDTGPNPVEYLLAAYAGCLNVLGHMVAEEMGIELRNLKIDVRGDIDPAGFTGQNPNVRPGFKEIRVDLDIATSASQEEIDKWLEAVESRCPVSDNLRNTTPTRVNVKTGALSAQ